MLATIAHLMQCGFRVVSEHTQSDEISRLFHREEGTFDRKYDSILADEASAKFSLLRSDPAWFDCRISQLLIEEDVRGYVRWHAEDAHRNALNAHYY
jgi:tRNA(His) guanylyltransferase